MFMSCMRIQGYFCKLERSEVAIYGQAKQMQNTFQHCWKVKVIILIVLKSYCTTVAEGYEVLFSSNAGKEFLFESENR